MLDKTANSVSYKGGDNQSVFPIPFPFIETSHVEAVLIDADGVATTLAAGIDFAVNSISDEDGEFILLGETVLARNNELTIRRIVPLTQEILFHNQGPNSPQAIEEGLDKLTMIAQQLAAAIARRLKAPDGMDPDELMRDILDSLVTVEEIQVALEALRRELENKGGALHYHDWDDIIGLQQQLEEKAGIVHEHSISDVSGLSVILASKADQAALDQKSPIGHVHVPADVQGLAQALGGKADVSALANYSARKHASAHAAGGEDPIAPGDIGCLPAPPADGKTYLANNGGWVEYIASGEGSGEGSGTNDHSQLLNRFVPDQHSQAAIQGLVGDLGTIRSDISGLAAADSALSASLAAKAGRDELPGPATTAADGLLTAADKRKLDSLSAGVEGAASKTYVDGELAKRDTRLIALESTRLTDAPSDGKAYVRSAGQWSVVATGIIGEIRLLPYRSGSLPDGWYFCNGDRFAVSSEQGKALAALPATFKSDWGIAVSGSYISLPNLFSGSDGYFLRPVDNSSRQPGAVQTDAIRNITGTMLSQSGATIGVLSRSSGYPGSVTGAFTRGADTQYSVGMTNGAGSELGFDASNSVPTASENRPLNIGMTPSIYLGV